MSKAIAYFANGIGNFVMMMPALQALRSLSDTPVDIVIPDSWMDDRKEAVEEICREWPVIGRVIHSPRESYDPADYTNWYWAAHGENSEAVIPFKSRMKHIPVARPDWRTTLIHERDYYLDIVRAMGWVGGIPDVVFPLAEYPVLDSKRPIIGLCNGAFGTPVWEKKRWQHFAVLSETLGLYFGAHIVGIGGKGELDGIPLNDDFSGKLSITATAKVISQLDLLITTDTGCMHIGDTIGVPMLALFGSTLISKNGPLGEKAIALTSTIECAPCQHTGRFFTCKYNECMRSIMTGDVMHKARRALL